MNIIYNNRYKLSAHFFLLNFDWVVAKHTAIQLKKYIFYFQLLIKMIYFNINMLFSVSTSPSADSFSLPPLLTKHVKSILSANKTKPQQFSVASSSSSHLFVFQDFQARLKDSSFKDIVIHGKELPGAIITALINVYIKDNASVDAISNHLRDICPLLYSSDDSVCSKVDTHTHRHICSSSAVKCLRVDSFIVHFF